MRDIVLVGYARHALVAHDIFRSVGLTVIGYCDFTPSPTAPSELAYFGVETGPEAAAYLRQCDHFVGIGDNDVRRRLQTLLDDLYGPSINAVHRSAVISPSARLGRGVMVGANSVVNALAQIDDGAICNTGSVVEHECHVGAFAHLCSGVTLAGGVKIGAGTFVGTGSSVIPDLHVEDNVVLGAGSVVIRSLPAGTRWVGNPCRQIG